MESSQVSLLIHRICSGKFYFTHNNQLYILKQPNYDLKYKAELLYQEFIQNNKYEILWTKESIKNLLKFLNLWLPNNDEHLKELEKQVDSYKLNMFLSKLNNEKVNSIKKELNFTRDYINKMLNKKHSLDYLTLEDAANTIKNEYLMTQTIFYDDEKTLVFDRDAKNIEYNKFIELTSYITTNFISIETYKIIARNEQWKSIWNSNKNNIFLNKSAYELSDEQKTIISISNMYDRIYEHPEAPDDSVINDDDMLDGWMIHQRQKADKTKKQNSNDYLNNRHKNAKEIFVVADKDDIDNIMDLNSDQSISVIKQRKKAISGSSEGVDEVFLPDVQRELLQKLNSRK